MRTIPPLLTLLVLHTLSWGQCDPMTGVPPSYGFVIGTQSIGPRYAFYPRYTRLEETARAILGMGSSYLKISLDPGSFPGYGISRSPAFDNPATLLKTEPSYQSVLGLPFTKYFFWVRSHSLWRSPTHYNQTQRKNDSLALDELVTHLLTNPALSGKEFYLGHWEGDWYLNPGEHDSGIYQTPADSVIDGMVGWLNMRHRAIVNARSRVSGSKAKVWDYVEVNKILDSSSHKRVVNAVLPKIEVDLVSCSCYELQRLDSTSFTKAMDYIQGNHHGAQDGARPRFSKSVFIGEFGFAAKEFRYNDSIHEDTNRRFLRHAVAWGAPMVLYWQIYNSFNEWDSSANRDKGLWLVTNTNRPTALYNTMSNFYANAQNWTDIWRFKYGKEPTFAHFQHWTSNILKNPVKGKLVPTLPEYLQMRPDSDTTLVDPHLLSNSP